MPIKLRRYYKMDFKLKFNMDNEAFDIKPEDEAREMLLDISGRLSDGWTYGKCIDYNGNVIGQWEIITDTKPIYKW